ncbi:MAG: saccharopine dehydrogenase NADP-binding domain-containing protein [candidate division Zixibacteria bacterium]|nr:saccharopine dehydrogenase NADP-binding domain-containing protein [candidate division Zixibacteria bacterium]
MKIAVIGSGLMGRAVIYDLSRAEGVKKVGLFDLNADSANEVAKKYGNEITTAGEIDAADEDGLIHILKEYDACISAVPYKFNEGLTRAAIKSKTHFFDLGGNNDVVHLQFEMNIAAAQADVTVIPDCGLAPGMVSVLAAAGIKEFDKVDSLRIRVGGLPQNPRPPLNYQMVFSAEGLINEYWEPVIILEKGEPKTVNPMSGLEKLEFDGIGELEAFYTSGGTSTLPQTYRGVMDFLDYKTIRYPGHCQIFKPMLEIGLGSRSQIRMGDMVVEPREVFKKVLEKNLTFNEPDLVLVRLTFEGIKDRQPKKLEYEIIDKQDNRSGLTSMMRCTAFPVAIIAWMVCSGKIDKRGVIPQELAVDPQLFITQLKKRNINLIIREVSE